jgi:hypothetical protein
MFGPTVLCRLYKEGRVPYCTLVATRRLLAATTRRTFSITMRFCSSSNSAVVMQPKSSTMLEAVWLPSPDLPPPDDNAALVDAAVDGPLRGDRDRLGT